MIEIMIYHITNKTERQIFDFLVLESLKYISNLKILKSCRINDNLKIVLRN